MSKANVETNPTSKASVVKCLVMLFKREKKVVRIPRPGEAWILKNKTPWPEKDCRPVTILDSTEEWVRYDMPGPLFKDQRMEMDSFLHCYTLHKA